MESEGLYSFLDQYGNFHTIKYIVNQAALYLEEGLTALEISSSVNCNYFNNAVVSIISL